MGQDVYKRQGIEYVASEDIDVKNANIADNNKADNLEIPALNATNQYIEYYACLLYTSRCV